MGKKLLSLVNVGGASVCASSIDMDRVFGIVLTRLEIDKIIENQKFFDFFLKHQNLSGDRLKDLTEELFISILAQSCLQYIGNVCNGCNGRGKSHDMCTKYIKDLSNIGFIIRSALEDPNTLGLFNEKFEQMADLMNVKPAERITQLQFNLIELKNDYIKMTQKLASYIDLGNVNHEMERVLNIKKYTPPTPIPVVGTVP